MIKTLAKIVVLSSMVMLLSACAGSNRYNGYSGNDAYSSGYNYPGGGGYYPQPAYPYGNYRNNSYNNPYPRSPSYPGYPANPGYGRPYYGGYPNNNYYNNRNQPRPIQAPPGFYRNQKPPVVEQHNHRHVENNYYYGRPPYNQGGKPGGYRAQPNPPAVGRNNWQGQQPQRNYGNRPNWGGNNQGNWQRQQGNNFNRQGGGGGQWQGQNRPQQPVVRIQNNGGNVNFGRTTDRMGSQPANPGQNRANWERRKNRRDND